MKSLSGLLLRLLSVRFVCEKFDAKLDRHADCQEEGLIKALNKKTSPVIVVFVGKKNRPLARIFFDAPTKTNVDIDLVIAESVRQKGFARHILVFDDPRVISLFRMYARNPSFRVEMLFPWISMRPRCVES